MERVAEFDKSQDAASYDLFAGDYHRYIERLSAPLAERAVALGALEAGQRVLDVGTGSGIAARYAARKVGPGGFVLGVDLSEGMLEVARSASRQQGLSNIEFQRMDAEALDLPDQSFDAVMSFFAVSHFPNIDIALAQMLRVLKRGHRLVVATGYGRPPLGYGLMRHAAGRSLGCLKHLLKPQRRAPEMILDLLDRRIPDVAEPDSTDWQRHAPTARLVEFIRAAGLREIETRWHGHVITFDSAEEYWEAQAAISTLARKRLLALEPKRVSQLHDEFLADARHVMQRGGKLYYPYGGFYVTGIRD